jgi:hypothetical protein
MTATLHNARLTYERYGLGIPGSRGADFDTMIQAIRDRERQRAVLAAAKWWPNDDSNAFDDWSSWVYSGDAT